MGSGRTEAGFTGPMIMLLSAGIFGFFGFMTTWLHYSATTGEFLFYVALLDWTLKVASIAFFVAAILAMIRPVIGEIVFSGVGLLAAISFVVVAIFDWMDPKHTAMSPLLLVLFALWNGYGAWSGLRAVLGYVQQPPGESGP